MLQNYPGPYFMYYFHTLLTRLKRKRAVRWSRLMMRPLARLEAMILRFAASRGNTLL